MGVSLSLLRRRSDQDQLVLVGTTARFARLTSLSFPAVGWSLSGDTSDAKLPDGTTIEWTSPPGHTYLTNGQSP